MNSVNYFRTSLEAHCNDCKWRGLDWDCEKWGFTEIDGTTWYDIKYTCPLCKGNDIKLGTLNSNMEQVNFEELSKYAQELEDKFRERERKVNMGRKLLDEGKISIEEY